MCLPIGGMQPALTLATFAALCTSGLTPSEHASLMAIHTWAWGLLYAPQDCGPSSVGTGQRAAASHLLQAAAGAACVCTARWQRWSPACPPARACPGTGHGCGRPRQASTQIQQARREHDPKMQAGTRAQLSWPTVGPGAAARSMHVATCTACGRAAPPEAQRQRVQAQVQLVVRVTLRVAHALGPACKHGAHAPLMSCHALGLSVVGFMGRPPPPPPRPACGHQPHTIHAWPYASASHADSRPGTAQPAPHCGPQPSMSSSCVREETPWGTGLTVG